MHEFCCVRAGFVTFELVGQGVIHWKSIALVALEHYGEGFGGDVYLAETLHTLLALGLLGQHLFFAGDISAVQPSGYFLTISTYVFTGYKFTANRRL